MAKLVPPVARDPPPNLGFIVSPIQKDALRCRANIDRELTLAMFTLKDGDT